MDFTRSDESLHADYQISQIIAHPDYKYPLKYNDIALISTTTTIRFTKFIRPACLNTKATVSQTVGIATGWGKLGMFLLVYVEKQRRYLNVKLFLEFSGDNSKKLMKVALNLYDNSECSRSYRNDKNLPRGISSSMLCAGELSGGRDTCQVRNLKND